LYRRREAPWHPAGVSATDGFGKGVGWQAAAYFAATTVAAIVVVFTAEPTWPRLLAADLAATVVVFGFSFAHRNSSLYDPYWSVAPPLLGFGFVVLSPEGVFTRQLLVLGLTTLWGIRLTYSFFRGWPGLAHEDWRYRDLRAKTGALYWLVSFFGIHMMPTVLTFGGSVAIFAALGGERSLGPLDAAATIVTLLAIWLEASADRQLRDYVRSAPAPDAILETGLWAYSRHPNYLGEILFWWGLALFALAAGAWPPLACSGALAITLLFVFISIPLIEKRMRVRRPGWDAHTRRVPILLPWRIGPLRPSPPGAPRRD